nr:deleted in malignant brain tumors 1 protein-like [Lytechinus pictus]
MGTVCDDDWDDTDATVVCQILGLGVLGRARTAAAFGEGRGSIILDEVQCDGTETDIFDCSSNGVKNHNCGHNEDAGVECTNRGQTTATPTRSIRLVNGPSNTTGRVEVYYNGEWGTVCDDDWDDTDATVVCQILGLGVLGRARTAAAFGEGRGSIILDEVQCDGTETDIFDCSSNGVKNHNCGHNEDAGVECTNRGQTTATPTRSIRLVNGPSNTTGRVEVYYNGEWGTVCDDDWDDTDATVVCQILGLGVLGRARTAAAFGEESIRLVNGPSNNAGRVEVNYNGEWVTVCDDFWDNTDATVVCKIIGLGNYGIPRTNAHFGEGSGSIILDNVECDGTETDIFDCSNNGANNSNCFHYEDAGVECSNT